MARSRLLPAFAALAAITAITLSGAAMAIRPPATRPNGDRVEHLNRTIVGEFYDALNSVFATGDSAPIASLLATDYIEYDAAGVAIPGRANLDQTIESLRAVAPAYRLAVERLTAEDDMVLALLRPAGADASRYLGLRLAARPDLWGTVDLFRLREGRIVERRSGQTPPISLTPAVQIAFLTRSSASAVSWERPIFAARRLTVDPGHTRRLPDVAGPRALFVEEGEVELRLSRGADDDIIVRLSTGESLDVAPQSVVHVTNTGGDPATLLDVSVDTANRAANRPPAAANYGPAQNPATLLAGDLSATAPACPAVLALGWIVLPADARFSWVEPGGPVLLFVERGTLTIAQDAALSWVRNGATGASTTFEKATLATGDGALLDAMANVDLTNAGSDSVRLLVVTWLPVDDRHSPRSAEIAPRDTTRSASSGACGAGGH